VPNRKFFKGGPRCPSDQTVYDTNWLKEQTSPGNFAKGESILAEEKRPVCQSQLTPGPFRPEDSTETTRAMQDPGMHWKI
jgi:hypothetical protein